MTVSANQTRRNGQKGPPPEFASPRAMAYQARILLPASVVARLLLAVAVVVAGPEFNIGEFRSAFATWPPGETPTLATRFATWDSAHYLKLSQEGYKAGSHSCAFYPLWPLVIRATTALTGGWPVLTSLLLANALSLVGLWLFYRLVGRHCGAAVSRHSLILMLAFPAAFFFSFPYTESLYLVILMLLFWGLELDRWAWTAVAGFLLPLARPVGVFIVLTLACYLYERGRRAAAERIVMGGGGDSPVLVGDPPSETAEHTLTTRSSALARTAVPVPSGGSPDGTGGPPVLPRAGDWLWGWLSTNRASLRDWKGRLAFAATGLLGTIAQRHALLLLCPLLGCATYFGTMYAWTGNAFEGFEAQKAYPYSPSIKNMFDFPAFWSAFINVRSVDGMMDSALDRGFFLLFLALLPAVWKLNRTWFWYTLPTGLVPALTSYFMSYRRYVMVLFPLFVVMAQRLAKGPRWIFWYYVILMAALQAWAVTRFVNFNWAG